MLKLSNYYFILFVFLIFIEISFGSTMDSHLTHKPINVPDRNSNFEYPESQQTFTKYTFYAPSTAQPVERPTVTPPQTKPPQTQPPQKSNNKPANNNINSNNHKSTPNYLRAPSVNNYNDYASPKSAIVSRKFSNDDNVITKSPQTQPPRTQPPQTQPPRTQPPQTQPPKTQPPQTEQLTKVSNENITKQNNALSKESVNKTTQPTKGETENPPKQTKTPSFSNQTPALANSNTPTYSPTASQKSF